jgi:hypothetical protein
MIRKSMSSAAIGDGKPFPDKIMRQIGLFP